MARENTSERDRTTSQGSDASRSAESTRDRSDRERSIRTDREGGRSTGVSRRQGTPPAYGSGGWGGNPFFAMQRMAEDMDRLFESFGAPLGRSRAE